MAGDSGGGLRLLSLDGMPEVPGCCLGGFEGPATAQVSILLQSDCCDAHFPAGDSELCSNGSKSDSFRFVTPLSNLFGSLSACWMNSSKSL